jgi:hypothetical protein
MLGQPQRRIGAGARVLPQATDHLDPPRDRSSGSKAASAKHPRPRSLVDRANRASSANAVGSWAARQAPISAAADASSCFVQRSSSLPASIAGELDLGEATRGSTSWSPAGSEPSPIPRAASSSRLTPSTRVAIATLMATPPRWSLSEHGQRAGGAEVGEPGSHYLLVAMQVTAHPCRGGCQPAANLCGSKQPASSSPCSGEDDEGRAEKHSVAYVAS